MVYEPVKGSNLALLLTVAQAFLWVPTLVDGLSIDIAAVDDVADGDLGCNGVLTGAIGGAKGC